MRRARDPIEHVRKMIVDHEVARSDELKKLERSIKKEVDHMYTFFACCTPCSGPGLISFALNCEAHIIPLAPFCHVRSNAW